ncbi:hypothetical protein [Telluribacter humicola]|jgi:hypothetical protein|uniref:hypothetical protein n=1 Tax=Telluribacter humicola TaxID=1720261 RepID=UPI001A961D7E|nr:hypothetical protein [Telluribacter humicola]
MNTEVSLEFFQDILITIHENIRDLQGKKVFADPEEQEYLSGRLFSYTEALEIMKDSARRFGYDPRELGL